MAFQLAHPDRSRVPRIIEKALAAAEAFPTGTLLLVDANDKFAQVGADPAQIAAVSVSPAGADTSGFNRFAKKEFPPGYMQGIALHDEYFLADIIGALPAAAGGDYGVVYDATLGWCVDFNEIGSTPVHLVDRLPFPVTPSGYASKVIVRFNEAFIQII